MMFFCNFQVKSMVFIIVNGGYYCNLVKIINTSIVYLIKLFELRLFICFIKVIIAVVCLVMQYFILLII